MNLFPRICFEMTNGEGEFLFFLADADHDGVDLLAVLKNITRAVDSACPREFTDVNETLDTGFELNEGAVGNEASNFATDLEIHRIFLGDFVPWVFRHLFEAEGDAEALFIDLENENFDLLTGLEHFGRVTEATPSHIGDVEETVESVEVDEGTEFGEIFDTAFDLGALVEVRQELGAFFITLFFDQFAAGENNVFAIFIQLHDAALESLAEEFPKVFRGVDIDLGGGKKGFDSDVEHEAAFDDASDDALDGFAPLAEFENLVPILFVGGFLAGEDDLAVFVLKPFEKNLDLLADGEIVCRAKFV